jgi:hypothetical protein
MKKVLIALMMAGSFPVIAQKLETSKIPVLAQSTFAKTYPTITDVKWENQDGNYKANFTDGPTKIRAVFNDKGERIQTEYPMEVKQTPGVITRYIEQNYKGEKIESLTRIDKPGTPPNYLTVVNGKNLLFGPNGQFISVEAAH